MNIQCRYFLVSLLMILLVSTTVFAASETSAAAQPLLVDQAFAVKAWAENSKTIIVEWDIQPGYYLYQDKLHFTSLDSSIQLAPANFPPAVEKSNSILGNYLAYEGLTQIKIPLVSAFDSSFDLQINFQGCSEKGYCYPPAERVLKINLGVNYPLPAGRSVSIFNFSAWVGFFIFGVLISLTPCVLPMIPILSAMILGKQHLSHVRAFLISLAYVLGMAVTYAIAGAVLGVLGDNLQAYMQKPWLIILFSMIFVSMALSLFGFYHLQPPEKLRAVMAGLTDRQKHGNLWGAAIMGCLSTLILSPCATPALVAILSYISASGNAGIGGLALFVVGIGMGAPLLLVGAFGRRILPKTGPWMRIVENLLGIILLAVAIIMLSRILPGVWVMLLWASLAIGLAVYMKTFSTTVGIWQRLSKSLGLLFFIYGILLMVGAVQGSASPWKPLVLNSSHCQALKQPPFVSVKTVADVQRELAQAPGKIALLDFYADWCASCKLIEQKVFANADVLNELQNVLLLRADVTANDSEDKELMKYFQVVAPPTIIFFDKQQHEINEVRIIGEVSAKEFTEQFNQIKALE